MTTPEEKITEALSSIPVLEFSHNWNNKLDCNAFATLRLENPRRYKIGMTYFVRTRDKDYGAHVIADIRELYRDQINEFIARLDTGYSKDECVKLLQSMYINRVTSWTKQKLYLILLVKIKTERNDDEKGK